MANNGEISFLQDLRGTWKTRKFRLENQIGTHHSIWSTSELWASGQSDAFLFGIYS